MLLVLPPLAAAGLGEALALRDARRALAPRADGHVVIAGETIVRDEIDRRLGGELVRLAWEAHLARLAWVEREVQEREARSLGLTREELVHREVDFKVRVSAEEIEREARPGEERMQAAARVALRKRPAVEETFRARLYAKYGVTVALPPPPDTWDVAFNPRAGPETGPPDAPVTVVLFSDFACPACARVHDWLKERPAGEVRIAFRHFPQGGDRRFSEAAAAAHAQGRFWDFADVLFRRGPALDAARLEEYAAEAGLDLAAFRRALASDAVRTAVDADVEEGRRLGVQATPGLFVNGVYGAGVPDPRLLREIRRRE